MYNVLAVGGQPSNLYLVSCPVRGYTPFGTVYRALSAQLFDSLVPSLFSPHTKNRLGTRLAVRMPGFDGVQGLHFTIEISGTEK